MKNLIVITLFVSFVAVGCTKREKYAGEWRDICQQNIANVQAAKNQWALERKKYGGEIPSESDILNEGPTGPGYIQRPTCPAKGTYSLNPVGKKVTCSIPSHN